MSRIKFSVQHKIYAFALLGVILSFLIYGCTTSNPKKTYSIQERIILDVIDGGRLYDEWWVEAKGAKEPDYDHPLWKFQSTNKLKGGATWRCKECHGWDYMGKDGVYGTGSHKTGFTGVLKSSSRSLEDIESILRGATNPDHDFSSVLDNKSISKLAIFIQKGLIDLRKHINYESKRPVRAQAENGMKLFNNQCKKCHGEKGNQLNFGSEDEKEFIGSVANSNPWEFVHKVRFGQAGTIMPSIREKLHLSDEENRMPSGIETGYKIPDVLDILEYARSLPAE